jgi:hypothetical protein
VILPVSKAKQAKFRVWNIIFVLYKNLKQKMKDNEAFWTSWEATKTHVLVPKLIKPLVLCTNKWFAKFWNQNMYFDGSRMILDQIDLLHWGSLSRANIYKNWHSTHIKYVSPKNGECIGSFKSILDWVKMSFLVDKK